MEVEVTELLKLKSEIESLKEENKEKQKDIQMLTNEIKELKLKGDEKEKALKDKTTKINTELESLKSKITKIVNAFSPVKKDLFKKSNVLYVLMKRVEAIEKQIHLVPTLAFDHVSMVERQTLSLPKSNLYSSLDEID